ncbi:DUF6463 family protein [Massilia sp. TWP1-3-3]|uniref:DUF6463 family protein n=1 Tax=Massilia sp. TWP1-3-3 TaxID=2804573 RepID=UPI003CF6F124
MRNWIGKWVMFVAIGHTVSASLFFGGAYRELIAGGLYDSVQSVKSERAVWFALFGIVLFIVGMLISNLEKNRLQVSKSVGLALLLLTTLGVLMMPISGFWLMFPAIFGIFYNCTSVAPNASA